MPQDTPQPVPPGLSRKRRALLGVYDALDPEHRLRNELSYLGVRLELSEDPLAMLEAAAGQPDDPERPRVHPLHLAFAAMRVLRQPPGPPDATRVRERVRRVAARLVNPAAPPDDVSDEAVEAVTTALVEAADPRVRDRDRWARVVEEAGANLDPQLAAIREAWCDPGLRQVADEVASRIETRLVVRDDRTIGELAPAVLPDNWKRCNDFFCDLIPVPGRRCPGATGGELTPETAYWRGVYEERVGECPAGWFPDTFLAFTWERTDRQLILRYELAPPRRGDRTVLKIDQGYIQVDSLPGEYLVSTVKYLLFDDRFIPGGGQTLGQSACQLGWLDCSINQFTDCAADVTAQSGAGTATDRPNAELDAGMQRVLDRCEAHLAETASDTDAQLTRTITKLRGGSYRLDDYVGDLGELATRGIRDGARSVQGQLDLAVAAADVVRILARRRGPRR
jgi:hypothetical protein